MFHVPEVETFRRASPQRRNAIASPVHREGNALVLSSSGLTYPSPCNTISPDTLPSNTSQQIPNPPNITPYRTTLPKPSQITSTTYDYVNGTP